MITALFVFNRKGETLISKLYKDEMKRNIADVFRIHVISNPEIRSPILTLGSTSFIHIKLESGLWFVAVTRSNQDVAVVLEFLYKFKDICEICFCSNKIKGNGKSEVSMNDMAKNVNNYLNAVSTTYSGLTEDDVANNFVMIYELLDQVLEFGFPRNMELRSIQQYLSSPLHNIEQQTISSGIAGTNSNNGITSILRSDSDAVDDSRSKITVDWRKKGIRYRKNQIFLDISEEINVLMTADGSILKSYVTGKINMKTKLSGMPTCKFGFNDSLTISENEGTDFLQDYDVKNSKAIPEAASQRVILEDCKFHPCVELEKFSSERLIQFVPPDGEFELMKYRCSESVNLPFIISPKIQETDKNTVSFNISIRSLFPPKTFATSVMVQIPLPKNTIKANLEATSGKAKFSTEDGAIVWKFNKFHGQNEGTLQGFANFVPNSSDLGKSPDILKSPVSIASSSMGWSRPPIVIHFNLDMFSCSGLVVRYLKVIEESHYSTVKWVKYSAKAGTYEVRY